MGNINAPDGSTIEKAPDSQIRLVDLEMRANEGRRQAARIFQMLPGGKGTLKAHADPFDTAIEAEVA